MVAAGGAAMNRHERRKAKAMPGEAWLTLDQLAREAGLDKSEVEAGIDKLVECGYLLVDGAGPLRRFRMTLPRNAREVSP
jgi:DNA-binding IclR family transcriptional regulator